MNANVMTLSALFFAAPVIAYAFTSRVIALAERFQARNAAVKQRGAEYDKEEAGLRAELFEALEAGDKETAKAVRNRHEIAADKLTKRG